MRIVVYVLATPQIGQWAKPVGNEQSWNCEAANPCSVYVFCVNETNAVIFMDCLNWDGKWIIRLAVYSSEMALFVGILSPPIAVNPVFNRVSPLSVTLPDSSVHNSLTSERLCEKSHKKNRQRFSWPVFKTDMKRQDYSGLLEKLRHFFVNWG